MRDPSVIRRNRRKRATTAATLGSILFSLFLCTSTAGKAQLAARMCKSKTALPSTLHYKYRVKNITRTKHKTNILVHTHTRQTHTQIWKARTVTCSWRFNTCMQKQRSSRTPAWRAPALSSIHSKKGQSMANTHPSSEPTHPSHHLFAIPGYARGCLGQAPTLGRDMHWETDRYMHCKPWATVSIPSVDRTTTVD